MARKRVALALQGGGSWGAYSWGVLDRLLADPDIQITEITGTSAGAINGSIIAHALNSATNYEDGAAQARQDLRDFWTRLCDSNHDLMRLLSMLEGKHPMAAMRDPVKNPNLPSLKWLQNTKSLIDANPFLRYSGLTQTFNRAVESTATRKLRSLIRDFIPSYDTIRSGKHIKLHVNAAEVTSQGLKNRNFSGDEVTLDAVMASATLRGLFTPVDIDGRLYFDGAYTQNPPVDPLMKDAADKRRFDDIIWVMSNPPHGDITPRHQSEIHPDELTQSADLILHHAYDHLAHNLRHETPHSAKSHVVWLNAPKHYDQTSKQNTEAAFLTYLYEEGFKSADLFLQHHKQDLGKRSTVNLPALQREGLRRSGDRLWPHEDKKSCAPKPESRKHAPKYHFQ